MMSSILILLSFTLIAAACARQDEDLSDTTIEQIARMIQDEVGSARASEANQCDMIPIGVKPAGGPWGYLVFSAEESSRERLERLVKRYNELDAERNEQNNGFSTADAAMPPELTFQNGTCRGDGPYAWNPGYILEFNEIE